MQFEPKPSDYLNLLEVFRFGLIHGLVTKNHIINWADGIVKGAKEPEEFFIELSIAHDSNRILEVIGDLQGLAPNIVTTRALFGGIYYQLSNDILPFKKAVGLLDALNDRDILTDLECAFIYQASDDYDEKVTEKSKDLLKADVLNFLKVYHEFDIDNYRSWNEISDRLQPFFKHVETGLKKNYKQSIRKQKWLSFKQDLTNLFIGLILLACAAFIFYSDSLMHPGRNDSTSDSSNSSIWGKLWIPIGWVAIWIGKWIYNSINKKIQPKLQSKADLRGEYLLKRQNLADEEYSESNELILQQFQQLDLSNINCIHLFLPIVENNEVNTYLLRDWLKREHPYIKVVHPKANFRTKTMKSFAYDADLRIETSRYGIPEPISGNEVQVDEIDLVILPMLIFDELGYRVGYGGGFYDRFCALCKPGTKFIGVSLFDPVKSIEGVDQYDVWMHSCITPDRLWEWH